MTSLSLRTVMARDSFTDSDNRLAHTHAARTNTHTLTQCIYIYTHIHANTDHAHAHTKLFMTTSYTFVFNHSFIQDNCIHTNSLHTSTIIIICTLGNRFITNIHSHNYHTTFIDTMHINFHTFGSVHFNRNTLRLA